MDDEDDDPTEPVAEDPPSRIPTVYDDAPPDPFYQDWDRESTRVVTYCIGAEGLYPGKYAPDYPAALADVTARFGKPVEVNTVPYRAFFRVRKQ